MVIMEPTNPQDPFVMAVIEDGYVVGHFPRTGSWLVSFSSGRPGVSAFVK